MFFDYRVRNGIIDFQYLSSPFRTTKERNSRGAVMALAGDFERQNLGFESQAYPRRIFASICKSYVEAMCSDANILGLEPSEFANIARNILEFKLRWLIITVRGYKRFR